MRCEQMGKKRGVGSLGIRDARRGCGRAMPILSLPCHCLVPRHAGLGTPWLELPRLCAVERVHHCPLLDGPELLLCLIGHVLLTASGDPPGVRSALSSPTAA